MSQPPPQMEAEEMVFLDAETRARRKAMLKQFFLQEEEM